MKRCPKCNRESLEREPSSGRVWCLYAADCGYSSKESGKRAAVKAALFCPGCGGTGTRGAAPNGKAWTCEDCGGDEDSPGTGVNPYATSDDIMKKVDELVAAERQEAALAEHVKMCSQVEVREGWPNSGNRKCGDGWLCSRAPGGSDAEA